MTKLAAGQMPDKALSLALASYKESNKLTGKGQIATMIFASRLARKNGLPFDVAGGITTEGEGQVKGLGKGAVQAILSEYGIQRVLAEEGGRTSRGSLGNIRVYLAWLNARHAKGPLDAASCDAWWVAQAKKFFNAKPFVLRIEHGNSIRSVIRDLLAQAKKRQDESAGTMFVGAMLQHLIGAKLSIALPNEKIEQNGYSVADAPTGRSADFEIGGTAIHVTTAPGEAVMRKCEGNIKAGLHPLIITTHAMLPAAEVFAEKQGIVDKIDVLDAEQFIVTNLHEWGRFQTEERRLTIEKLVAAYNAIVDEHETDPSLKISSKVSSH